MEESKKNNKEKFLKENLRKDISKMHKAYLGTELPDNYFVTSKASILEQVTDKEQHSRFLKDNIADSSQHHKDYLGTEIPENYFATSKLSILDKIVKENAQEISAKKQKVFYLRPLFKYTVAASLVFLICLTVWLQQSNLDDITNINIESIAFSDDVLVESLLVDDDAIDSFTEATLFEEVVVKAEEKEQKLDNLILNSLMVEDSLLDDYIKDELIETVIL